MVADGEYRDELVGGPGVVALPEEGSFTGPKRQPLRRFYWRGSPEHVEARRQGLLDRLPPLAPASQADVDQIEGMLGHSMPSLLRRLYLEVGNGGWGPGYGVLGLTGGHRDDLGKTAVDLFVDAHQDPQSTWRFLPGGLLPLCHRGCAIYSFTDCSTPDGRIWAWDPNPGPTDGSALFDQGLNLVDWLARWVAGTAYQPALVLDPDSRSVAGRERRRDRRLACSGVTAPRESHEIAQQPPAAATTANVGKHGDFVLLLEPNAATVGIGAPRSWMSCEMIRARTKVGPDPRWLYAFCQADLRSTTASLTSRTCNRVRLGHSQRHRALCPWLSEKRCSRSHTVRLSVRRHSAGAV